MMLTELSNEMEKAIIPLKNYCALPIDCVTTELDSYLFVFSHFKVPVIL